MSAYEVMAGLSLEWYHKKFYLTHFLKPVYVQYTVEVKSWLFVKQPNGIYSPHKLIV